MDAAMLQQLIGTLGFPIACTIGMFWMWNKERDDHKQEIQNVTTALNNNTQALIRIEEYLKNGKD